MLPKQTNFHSCIRFSRSYRTKELWTCFRIIYMRKPSKRGDCMALGGATMRHCWAIIYVHDLQLPGSIKQQGEPRRTKQAVRLPLGTFVSAFVTACFPRLGNPSPCLPLSYVGTMEGSTTLTSLIHDYCSRYHYFPSCGVEFEWFLKKSRLAC